MSSDRAHVPHWHARTDAVACPTLRASGVRPVVCVARQIVSELELGLSPEALARKAARPRELRRHDGKRGRASTHLVCRTDRCEQGRAIRAAMGGGDLERARAMAARAPRCSDKDGAR